MSKGSAELLEEPVYAVLLVLAASALKGSAELVEKSVYAVLPVLAASALKGSAELVEKSVYAVLLVLAASALKLLEGGDDGITVAEPGPGVKANGGPCNTTTANRKPNGPGVVAIAGGPTPPGGSSGSSQAQTLAETGNVGVFGQGGDQVEKTINGVTFGPDFAGAGVVGRGGVHRATDPLHPLPAPVEGGPGGAGVVGIAGDSKTPSPVEYARVGVFGTSKSQEGVKGVSISGVGISGESSQARGAVFRSSKQAQLNLIPVLEKPDAVVGKSQLGDLLVTKASEDVEGRGTVEVAHLFFCNMVDADGVGAWIQLA